MKLVIPAAGKGTRMRPLTHSVAKPLIPIAGKPALQHIIDQVLATQGVEVTGIIFIVNHLSDQIEEWARDTYNLPMEFPFQKSTNGTADAIKYAEPYVGNEDMLIIFSDTLFDADLEVIAEDKEADGIIWCAETDEPERFGIVSYDDEKWMTEVVEKPEKPTSNLANLGMHYVKNSKALFSIIDVMYNEEMKTKGEYYLTDAFQIQVNNGEKIRVAAVEGWHDTGAHNTTLATNKLLLAREGKENSIHETARVENSTLKNCIVMHGVHISNCKLTNSIIGPNCIVRNVEGHVLLDSDSFVDGHGFHD